MSSYQEDRFTPTELKKLEDLIKYQARGISDAVEEAFDYGTTADEVYQHIENSMEELLNEINFVKETIETMRKEKLEA